MTNKCWIFQRSESNGSRAGERETWFCKHCSRQKIVMSYKGKRNDNSICNPCKCLK
jgi:hypothetical protein